MKIQNISLKDVVKIFSAIIQLVVHIIKVKKVNIYTVHKMTPSNYKVLWIVPQKKKTILTSLFKLISVMRIPEMMMIQTVPLSKVLEVLMNGSKIKS